MTALQPKPPYTDEELRRLYPAGLELQQVQVLMRHGERTPVSARFQNAGLPPFWPYCSIARQLKSAVLQGADAGETPFSTLEWKRRLETFGPRDQPKLAAGPRGQVDNICDMGALTDVGRASTHQLGRRLRSLYVDRLGFLPPDIRGSAQMLYLRTTPVPRALESMQEAFSALYPPSTRLPGPDGAPFEPPTILSRTHSDETLFPNDGNCRRLATLSRAFAQRTADRWNMSEDMEYLNRVYAKWMPEDSPRVAVDSRPRLSGIMDTVNSTLAHGPDTKLPREFYDQKARDIMERIGVEEWFSGYKESREYRALGVGSLMGDIVGRMVGSAEGTPNITAHPISPPAKFGLSGCHDTTLAGALASLGAYETDKWPPFTSHVAFELFRAADRAPPPSPDLSTQSRWWSSLWSNGSPMSAGIRRKPIDELSQSDKEKLRGYYVRVRYNDRPVTVPGCHAVGKHLEGDESFCTLEAFKTIVDKFTPRDWKEDCRKSVKSSPFPEKPEPAGY
ncbi:hypothetical protein RB601_003157 [Gaeumannomyces tritici]